MTREEFNEWLRKHAARFSSVKRQVLKGGDGGKPDLDTIEEWWKVMRGVDFDSANAVSESMFAGSLEPPTRTDAHPRFVRGEVNRDKYGEGTVLKDHPEKPEPTYVGREPVYKCDRCRDEGLVTIWGPLSHRAMRAGVFDPAKHIRTCAVRCTCSWGQMLGNIAKKVHWPYFDPHHHLPVKHSAGDEEAIAELEAFIRTENDPEDWKP